MYLLEHCISDSMIAKIWLMLCNSFGPNRSFIYRYIKIKITELASTKATSMIPKLRVVHSVLSIRDTIISTKTWLKSLAQQNLCLTDARASKRRFKLIMKTQALEHFWDSVWLTIGFHKDHLDLQCRLKPKNISGKLEILFNIFFHRFITAQLDQTPCTWLALYLWVPIPLHQVLIAFYYVVLLAFHFWPNMLLYQVLIRTCYIASLCPYL